MQEDKNLHTTNPEEEQEIDLLELGMKLWDSRKLILWWVLGGIVLGLVVAFSIPREYSTKIVLAPEVKDGKSGSGISSLAAMAGINLSAGSSTEALNPVVYPDIVSSVPFSAELFDVAVQTSDKHPQTLTVREFIEDETKGPWWSTVLGLPLKAIGGVMSLIRGTDDEEESDKPVNPFHLSMAETKVVSALNQRISADVDTKSSMITVMVTMQDPLVSAMLADTVVTRLQEYVTRYRTNKARADLNYAQLLYDEAKENYHNSQQEYANYVDRNQNISLKSRQVETERLQNEAQLSYNVYNQTAQQLQIAKAKVQELAPVYTVIQPATVPLRPSKPSKAIILIGFIFLTFVVSAAWILYGRDLVATLKTHKRNTDIS